MTCQNSKLRMLNSRKILGKLNLTKLRHLDYGGDYGGDTLTVEN